MAEEGVEEQKAGAPVEGAIGKLEPDPANPEVKTGEIVIRIHEVNGVVYLDHRKALEFAKSEREKGTKV